MIPKILLTSKPVPFNAFHHGYAFDFKFLNYASYQLAFF